METGVIVETISFGAGSLSADADAAEILFTVNSFKHDWALAVRGAHVEFERFAKRNEAKVVYLRGRANAGRRR